MSTGSRRPLNTLGLCSSAVSKLLEADFIYDDDVKDLKPTDLSLASSLSLKESAEVIRLATASVTKIQPVTVLQMIEDERDVTHIVTFSKALDDLLGGGIPLSAITEVSGTPGIGKTQLCFQACVSVQLPSNVGGVGGEAVFVDTEGSFSAGRVKDMASHAVQHVKAFGGKDEDVLQFTVESILRRIHYFRCHSYIEVMAVIKHIPTLLESNPRIQLFVIDSIAFHFRHDFPDMMARTGLLCRITQELIQQATKHNMAIILTNQMTTRIENDGSSQLVAALGETWGHCPTIRLVLHWDGQVRAATLTKAPHRSNGTAKFQVMLGGIRDYSDYHPSTSQGNLENISKKRKNEEP